ncbi:MAG: hypothetical protein WDN49_18060 [Acetobacteraceae bacterium]
MPAKRVFIYTMLFLMTAISYLDRVNLSVAAGPLAQEVGLSPVQLGWLFSGFLWTYIIFLVPSRATRRPVRLPRDRPARRGALVGGDRLHRLRHQPRGTGRIARRARHRRVRGVAGRHPDHPRLGAALRVRRRGRGDLARTVRGRRVRGLAGRLAGARFRVARLLRADRLLGLAWAAIWFIFVRDPTQARWLGEASGR